MTVLTKDERTIIRKRLLGLGPANLAMLYQDLTDQPSAWIALQDPAIVVVKLIDEIGQSQDLVIETCDWLVSNMPAFPDNPHYAAIAERLQQQASRMAMDPIDEIWVGSVPVLNRSKLRALLREICEGHDHGVVYVVGGPASGRSHGWKLIRHVARQKGITHHYIDFSHDIEARTILHLFENLKEAYALPTLVSPTHEGATPGDVARKFAARLRERLRVLHAAGPKPWVIIDFTDDVADPAVGEFIRLFCADRYNDEFDNCIVFVLGPHTHFETMSDLGVEHETLGPITSLDIRTAAEEINRRGTAKIDTPDLSARIEAIIESSNLLAADKRNEQIRMSLVNLRSEVRAP